MQAPTYQFSKPFDFRAGGALSRGAGRWEPPPPLPWVVRHPHLTTLLWCGIGGGLGLLLSWWLS